MNTTAPKALNNSQLADRSAPKEAGGLATRVLPVLIRMLILAGLMGALAYWALGRPLTGIDDANIFFVYARNLVRGLGFVYVPDGERVEGFSSFAWVLVCAAAFAVTSHPEALLFATGVAMLAVTITVLICWVRFALRQQAVASGRGMWVVEAMVLAWLFLSTPAFAVWTTVSLMDVGLWTMLICIGAVMSATAPDWPAKRGAPALYSAVLVLMIATRPEAAAWAPCMLLVAIATRWWRGQKLVTAAKSMVIPAIAAALAYGGLLIFSLAYFGFAFPNTYYAKVSPNLAYRLGQGSQYLFEFMGSHWLIIGFILGGLWSIVQAALSIRARERTPPWLASTAAIAVLIVVGLALPAVSGGDHFSEFRFYQPIYPLLPLPVLMLGVGILGNRALAGRGRWPGVAAALALTGGMVGGGQSVGWTNLKTETLFIGEWFHATKGRNAGQCLNATFPADDLPKLGVTVAGGIAYTYAGETIDLLGLNNVEMAHAPGDRIGYRNHAAFNKDVFYRQHPVVLLPLYVDQSGADAIASEVSSKFSQLILRDIFLDQRFKDQYQLVELTSARMDSSCHFVAFADRQWLAGQGGAVTVVRSFVR